MNRRRVLIHLVSLTAVLLLVIIASAIGVHVYSKRARRNVETASSSSSSSSRPPSPPFIWNHAISSGGRLEVEERFVVTDEDYPTTTPRKTSDDLLVRSFGGSTSTTSSALIRGEAEPVGEVRSAPVFTQNRPVFYKPSPKPKVVLKPPQSLLKKEEVPKKDDDGPKEEEEVTRVTQTVYGFLDFVTTIGNTVMVFTPQTKKVEAAIAAEVKPTQSSEIFAVTVKATEATTPPPPPPTTEAPKPKEVSSSSSTRQGKGLNLEEKGPVVIEASEVDPSSFGQESLNVKEVTPSTPELHISSQVHVVASPNLESGEFIEDPTAGQDEGKEGNDSREGNSSEEDDSNNNKDSPPPPPPPPPSKGFTLKLHKTPVLVTPAFSTPVVVTAQKVNLPPPPPPPKPVKKVSEEPTGVINKIYETRVNEGKTTVLETKIIGTYIGTQYAQLLDVSSSILPAKIEPTKSLVLSNAQPSSSSFVIVTAASAPSTTPKPVSTSPSVDEEQHQSQHDDLEESSVDHDELSLNEEETSASSPSSPPLEPTPTASEEQTRYVLPEKQPEKVYVSPVPNPNAYSRQPQLYVDINPAKSVDVIVTATPTRGKQFRLSNRFTSRLNKNQASSPGTDSNELLVAQDTPAPPPPQEESGRGRSRFSRNRGRSGSKASEEVAVPTVIVSATPTRRFKSGSGRTSAVIVSSFSSTGSGRSKEFKPNRGGGGFTSRAQAVVVTPTSSSSIYRFKLNRPTGRWRFKPSPKPKVNIIKTKEEEEAEEEQKEGKEQLPPTNAPVYLRGELDGEIQHPEETRTDSNELAQEIEPELALQTLRVATVTPSEFSDLDKYLEIATIKSPYVFQAGNVKNTRYITVTKTFTKENIQPTLASSVNEATLENILATKPPYEKILEGSSDVATLPVIVLGSDMATPPLETITQSFSTTQLMLKTSILPVLYDGVTTLYTLTQSYFVTRLVTAHKTVPPVELFQFVPTKSLTEFNTALQEAGSEHREHLLGSESDDENDTNYEHILAPPDELTSVGSDFDPSAMMDDKMPTKEIKQRSGKEQTLGPKTGDHLKSPTTSPANPFAQPPANSLTDPLAGLAGLTPEQLAFIRYFTAQNQAQQQQPQQQQQLPQLPQAQPPQQYLPSNPLFPNPLAAAPQQPPLGQPAFSVTSSPVVVDTTATIVETKTLRLLFGAKPTHTLIYSTKVVPTRMTTYVTASVPVKPTAAIANPFLNALPFPLAYVG